MGKFVFQIGRNRLSLNSLSSELNEQFKNLHEAYLSDGTFEWNRFEDSSHNFFDDAHGDSGRIDSYFNNFTPIWKNLLNQGLFREAENIWKKSLEIAVEWEGSEDARLHKGTPYYFWGMTSILDGQMDKGFFLMHQALDEDIETEGEEDPSTPARYFVLLNPEEQAQAFRRKIIEISEFLKNFLEKYCSNRNRNLDFDNLRDGFLEEVDLRETAFSFVHDLFKLEYTLERTEGIKMDHAFGSIYQANLLFSLCRDIENVLSYKYQRGADNPTFYNYVGEELLPQSSLNMDQNKLGEINGARKNDFEDTVRKLLEETYQFDGGTAVNSMEADIGIAYCFRNFGAHSIEDYPVIYENFEEITERILNTLFLTVEVIY